MAALEVLAPGALTSVQDARGRPGFERYGVATGGAMDPFAAELANALVGNPPDTAVLEATLAGPTLRFSSSTAFALAGGDLGALLDDAPLEPGWSWLARPGSVLRFGERRHGLRAYLAVAGGFQVERVLGSPSTDLRAGFGGLQGRALAAGDRLEVPDLLDPVARTGRWLASGERGEAVATERGEADPLAASSATPGWGRPVRVLPGPHLERFEADALEAFCGRSWRISSQADRMGYRLVGEPIRHQRGADVTSLGLPLGAIQVPGDGQPIVLLADHQPTGGYTVLACAIRADLGLLAQRGPGEWLRFERTTVEDARAALRAQRAALAAVQGDEATWEALRRAGEPAGWLL